MTAGASDPLEWSAVADSVEARHVVEESARSIDAYRAKPSLVREHANIERATAQGGYGHRQLYELVQNGADALSAAPGGRIHVVLTSEAVYCANEGAPIDIGGIEAILSSHVSMKRGTEIGRFGLGFKSVLGVSSSPSFFSRSVSFGFNAPKASKLIRSVVPDAGRTPVLRTADLLDPVQASADDPTLHELFEWATTVVRLPRDVGDSSWLHRDIEAFPAEFLIFSPHVGSLVLEDREAGLLRTIRVQAAGTSYRLVEDEEESEWKVFSTMFRPSRAARDDAGELSDRESLPLIWAVPTRTQRQRGAFWAFFPTTYETTLRGIVNAPWKTNEDRQNLLEGTFNEELLDAAAELVISHLPDLTDPEDPGRVLEYLPGRREDARQWADRQLSDTIYAKASRFPCLPDQLGRLRRPDELRIHPANAPLEAVQLWADFEGRPLDWCHPSVSSGRERRPRAERLLGDRDWAIASFPGWLESLVEDATASASIAAIAVASSLQDSLGPRDLGEMSRADIVLTESDSWVGPQSPQVFLRSEWEVLSEVEFVHHDVATAPGVEPMLERLGVDRVDPDVELEEAARRLFRVTDWPGFWALIRAADSDRAVSILQDAMRGTYNKLRIRAMSERFELLEDVLLPGEIVPGDGSRDESITVDVEFHHDELEVITALGVADRPRAGAGRRSEVWFDDYRQTQLARYQHELKGRRSNPQFGKLQFDRAGFPGPMSPLRRLSPEGRARFADAILESPGVLDGWTLAHETRRDTYPVVAVESPAAWILHRFGALRTSLGPAPVPAAVGSRLVKWSGVLPVARLGHDAGEQLGLPADLADLSEEQWIDGFAQLELLGDDPTLVSDFYIAAVENNGPDPGPRLFCQVGDSFEETPRSDIVAVASDAEEEALAAGNVAFLRCSSRENADLLVEHLGLKSAVGLVENEIDPVPAAAETPMLDAYPFLRPFGVDENLILVRCSQIRLLTRTPNGTTSTPVASRLTGDRFYCLDSASEPDVVWELVTVLGLDIDDDEIAELVAEHRNSTHLERSAIVAAEPDIARKLLAAVGVDALRRYLPEVLLSSVPEASDEEIASLYNAVLGVDSLKTLKPDLRASGLAAPQQWAGGSAAVTFVRDLGFPREYAGFEEGRRSPFLEVDGPVELAPLHDYQLRVGESLKTLLTEKEENRGLLSLPTGAGKTRVAVQSVVEAIADGIIEGPVLWVAQTDELCEQAVQTWSYVWRAIGPRTRLHISRLWAHHGAEPVDSGTQVVVTTVAKVRLCTSDPRYEWLSAPSLVIIDEAHSSTAPVYTEILAWLGLGRGRRSRPLIGLTATPFRGRSETGARDLAARYGKRRLDADVFNGDPYPILQDMGVLARVRHSVLGGSQIALTPQELELLRQTRRLPPSVEERLGADSDRNDVILDSILALPDDWTALVFAASVGHAETLAALLSLRGVPARSISAATPPAARRHYVSEFRAGRLRVLTNYGVLTEGFDAPAVRAVYVGRPTFSPNLYQQMVGRGLRGPRNGGKEECLVVDVADNIVEYGGELAFRGFDYLWTA